MAIMLKINSNKILKGHPWGYKLSEAKQPLLYPNYIGGAVFSEEANKN